MIHFILYSFVEYLYNNQYWRQSELYHGTFTCAAAIEEALDKILC